MRERLRLGAAPLEDNPKKRATTNSLVNGFIHEGSCRHKRPLGSPCVYFDSEAKGVCKLSRYVCDVLTAKGERYRNQYE